ncbi:MAG: TetR family transcriptional regulator, partial [Cyanobacteria bacterium J06631_2]
CGINSRKNPNGVNLRMTESASQPPKMRRKPKQARSRERVNRILDAAEQLLIEGGYTAATTNAIAARAQVPIGTLYQFFPDKAAILYALAERYGELLRKHLLTSATERDLPISLPDYVEELVDAIECFYAEHPGYHAIFAQAQGALPELERMEEALDTQLIEDWTREHARWDTNLTESDCHAIAFVLVKAIGTLMWLSLGQETRFRQRLVSETKRFTLSYLQTYFLRNSENL